MFFKKRRRSLTAVGITTVALLAMVTPAHAAGSTAIGPNTDTAPYLVPVADGVDLTSLLTVDDAGSASNGYEMVGIPDGLGLQEGLFGTSILTMNHELPATTGITRRHGQQGSFISQLILGKGNNRVYYGRDLINPGVQYWDYLSSSYSTSPNGAGVQPDGDMFPAYDARFGRFCSASLTDTFQLFNFRSWKGYIGQLRFGNEETGDEGRAFAVDEFGRAWQLPRLGLFSWENTLVAHNRSDTTLVMGQEDTAGGQLWAYVGTKQYSGTPVDKAGLNNGVDFVADLLDETVETDAQFRAKFPKGSPAPFDLADVDWDQSGADQNAEAAVDGLTLNRIEDGAFDPNNRNDFYFVTTAGGNGPGGGVWRLHWHDIERPQLGGTLTLLLDGSEGLVFPDNVDMDTHGNLLIQEDPGNNPHLARVVGYRIADGKLATVAQFDPALFAPGAPGLITQDEESSGIIDVEDVYHVPGTFLLVAQVHAPPANNAEEYVERGQLLRLRVADWNAVYNGGWS